VIGRAANGTTTNGVHVEHLKRRQALFMKDMRAAEQNLGFVGSKRAHANGTIGDIALLSLLHDVAPIHRLECDGGLGF